MPSTLYLIPTPIAEQADQPSASILALLTRLNTFIVEEPKTARRFIRSLLTDKDLQSCTFLELNEHTREKDLEYIIKPLLDGNDVGLLSEAGVPCVADPGSNLVRLAHQHSIRVAPLVGPSAILLSVMASGLNGQNFSFHGYPPKDKIGRSNFFAKLEAQSAKDGYSHFFIETPYRNQQVFSDLLETLSPQTLLFVGQDLLGEKEFVSTKKVSDWKNAGAEIHKVPTVFGF